jgi:hypothetical protein
MNFKILRTLFIICFLVVFSGCQNKIAAKNVSRVVAEKRKFEVMVKGQNFLILVDGKLEKRGFYTKRFVEAKDREEAEYKVMDIMRSTKGLQEITKNEKNEPPLMYAEEITEIKSFNGIETLEPGLVWYREDNTVKSGA